MEIVRGTQSNLVITKAGKTIVIDPGSLGDLPPIPGDLAAVIVTHNHLDHVSDDHLDKLLEGKPDTPLLGPPDFAAASKHPVQTVKPGDTIELGGFTLSFFGGSHEVIHESIPVIDNVGLLIDKAFYYPGDAFQLYPEDALDGAQLPLLAVPVSGPWLKLSDAMDFVIKAGAARAFPIHDALLSEIGKDIHYRILNQAAQLKNTTFTRVDAGEKIAV